VLTYFFVGGGCPFCTSWSKNWYSSNATPMIVSTLPQDWQTSSEVSVSTYIIITVQADTIFHILCNVYTKFIMEKRLARQYYRPNGYWKGFGAIRKLAQAAKVSENVAKRWLFK